MDIRDPRDTPNAPNAMHTYRSQPDHSGGRDEIPIPSPKTVHVPLYQTRTNLSNGNARATIAISRPGVHPVCREYRVSSAVCSVCGARRGDDESPPVTATSGDSCRRLSETISARAGERKRSTRVWSVDGCSCGHAAADASEGEV